MRRPPSPSTSPRSTTRRWRSPTRWPTAEDTAGHLHGGAAARQRHRRRRATPLTDRLGDQRHRRHRRPERRRHRHLHAGRQLQRRRRASPTPSATAPRTSAPATVTVNVTAGQRRPGGGRRHAGAPPRTPRSPSRRPRCSATTPTSTRDTADRRLGDQRHRRHAPSSTRDGTVTFTPNANFNGAAELHLHRQRRHRHQRRRRPSRSTSTPVNDAPVAVDDTPPTDRGHRRSPITAAQLLGNDTDVDDATPLTVASVTSGTGGTARAEPATAPSPSRRTPTSTAPPSFTYTVSDGTGTSAPATVTVNVAPVNDAPVAVADTLARQRGHRRSPSRRPQLLGNDTDVDTRHADRRLGDQRHRRHGRS